MRPLRAQRATIVPVPALVDGKMAVGPKTGVDPKVDAVRKMGAALKVVVARKTDAVLKVDAVPKTDADPKADAGLKTGEDGPTHADPQPLQLLQENFPRGTAVTLTPWDPLEIWPTLTAALRARPALIAPFVTRPNEVVPDREALRLPPAVAAAQPAAVKRRSFCVWSI